MAPPQKPRVGSIENQLRGALRRLQQQLEVDLAPGPEVLILAAQAVKGRGRGQGVKKGVYIYIPTRDVV